MTPFRFAGHASSTPQLATLTMIRLDGAGVAGRVRGRGIELRRSSRQARDAVEGDAEDDPDSRRRRHVKADLRLRAASAIWYGETLKLKILADAPCRGPVEVDAERDPGHGRSPPSGKAVGAFRVLRSRRITAHDLFSKRPPAVDAPGRSPHPHKDVGRFHRPPIASHSGERQWPLANR